MPAKMPIRISKTAAKQTVEAIEAALRDGHPPPGRALAGRQGAVLAAAGRLGIDAASLRNRIRRGGPCERHGLKPNWRLFRAPPPADPIGDRREADRAVELRRRLASAERIAADAREHRASILHLAREPLRPAILPAGSGSKAPGGRSVIAHLSDVHRGERVSLSQMDGVNAYDAGISRARLGRFFAKVGALSGDFWHGRPPDELILCLGGDMISGMIHFELVETNDQATPRAVRELGEDIAGGLAALWRKLKRPIRVVTVPGNHARLTIKSQAKNRAAHNLDLLVADFAEAALRGAGVGPEAVKFFATESPDAYFNVYNWNFCLTHGDAMGVGGGKGYIGPIAPITKGHRLLVDSSSKTGRRVHYALTAHYHTTARTPFGWANGSVIGYNEYARDLRADPEPAKQNLLVVHREQGVIAHQELYLGAPGEGRLYEGGK